MAKKKTFVDKTDRGHKLEYVDGVLTVHPLNGGAAIPLRLFHGTPPTMVDRSDTTKGKQPVTNYHFSNGYTLQLVHGVRALCMSLKNGDHEAHFVVHYDVLGG